MRLQQRFPGSELVFDTLSPPMVRLNNLRMRGTQVSARYHWGLTRAKDVEAWGSGIRLLDEWHPFDRPEPRLAAYRWLRYVPPIAKVIGVFHFQLGDRPCEQGGARRPVLLIMLVRAQLVAWTDGLCTALSSAGCTCRNVWPAIDGEG